MDPKDPDAIGVDTQMNLDKAIELLKTEKFDWVILCGGRFVRGQRKSAARAMQEYLQANLPAEIYNRLRIIVEDTSVTTRQNFHKGMALLCGKIGEMARQALHVVVSEKYHTLGATSLMRRSYWLPVRRVYSPQQLPLKATLRRLLQVPFYWIDPNEQWEMSQKEVRKRREAANQHL